MNIGSVIFYGWRDTDGFLKTSFYKYIIYWWDCLIGLSPNSSTLVVKDKSIFYLVHLSKQLDRKSAEIYCLSNNIRVSCSWMSFLKIGYTVNLLTWLLWLQLRINSFLLSWKENRKLSENRKLVFLSSLMIHVNVFIAGLYCPSYIGGWNRRTT